MRLIDADELKKHKYHSDITHENAVSVAQIDWMPTVCDIEQIRAEIKHLLNRPSLTHVVGYDKGFVDGIDKVLQIIDKYREDGE